MRAQHWTWSTALAIAIGIAACGDDDDVVPGDPQQAAAEALARAMHFTGGELRDGAMGIATEDRVELLLASEQVVHPGVAGLMPLEVDNPVAEDNPEVALLMQFGDADQHVRVPTKKSVNGPGDLNFEFELDDNVCNGLCASTIQVGVIFALELDDGAIGKHEKTSIGVDCSKRGSKAACSGSGKPGSGGARDGGTDTAGSGASGRDGSVPVNSVTTAAVEDLLAAVDDFDTEVCSCLPGAQADTCLNAVDAQLGCNEAVLLAFGAGNEDLIACTQAYFEDQYQCVLDAKCESAGLEACTAASTMTTDNWAAIESECGTVPAGIRNGIDACGDELTCPSGEPLTPEQRCDGSDDCPDGSDELGCGVSNPGNPGLPMTFPCSNGTTLALGKVCDGTMNCPDGTDETVCIDCPNGGGKYSPYSVCDGKNQCADGSDEAGCMYPCLSGDEMINTLLVCNGTRDCSDGSDESFCNGNGFTCPNGEVIPIMQVCDGIADCPDGGDEAMGLCGT